MAGVLIAPTTSREECERAILRADRVYRQRVESEWAKTEIGALFLRYENLTARAWQVDSNPNASDRSMAVAWERATTARRDLLTALRGF